ncbi:MAG: LysM peptidoglycan-binding domain-containing protein, partial [Sporichthyaceae bacterium]|nr:LysM peptidoglycan-binding domain-containing protein [Sporichthyaceae bacterium]
MPCRLWRVEHRDTLWEIAERCLGDGRRYREILDLNAGRIQPDGRRLTTATMIHPGWVLAIPTDGFTPAPGLLPVHGGTTVVVGPGQTLTEIARQHYGDTGMHRLIYQANAGRTQPDGRRLTDPDLIVPGWTLELPAMLTPPPAPAEAQPPPPASQPVPGLEPDGVTPDPSSAMPTATTGPRASGSTPGGSPRHEPDPAPDRDPNDRPATDPDGVAVPGGWVGVAFAAALVAAATRVWLQRRFRHRVRSVDDLGRDDADLAPLPPVIDRLRREVRRTSPELLRPPDPGPTVREYLHSNPQPELPPMGPTGAELAGIHGLLDSAGSVAFTGPGAADAARALLVAGLAAGSVNDPDAHTQVIIPAATLATLLGVPAVDIQGTIPRLSVTAGLGHALNQLEEQVLHRRRLLTDLEADDVAAMRRASPLSEPVPQILLITDPPEPAEQARLATAITLGRVLDIRIVVLGEFPAGATVTVNPDGTTAAGSLRVAVLDQSTALQMLEVVREADTGQPPNAATGHPAPDPGIVARHAAAVGDTDRGIPQHAADPDRAGPPHPADTRPEPATAPAVDPAAPRVSVRVLGVPAIIGRDGQPVGGLRAKAVELLVYLALHRDGAALNDIMEALWPDATL